MRKSNRMFTVVLVAASLAASAEMARGDGYCPDQPASGCRVSTKPYRDKYISTVRGSADGPVERHQWRWANGEATSVDEFGDMSNPNNALLLCAYANASDPVPMGGGLVFYGSCVGADDTKWCWTRSSHDTQKVQLWNNPGLQAEVVLKPGAEGRARVLARFECKGSCQTENAMADDVVLQLIRPGTDLCWESRFEMRHAEKATGTMQHESVRRR